MKKKIFLQGLFLIVSSFVFAKKINVQIEAGPFFTDYDYSVSSYKFTSSGLHGADFSLSNFNFFDNEDHFGIFEKISFQAGKQFGVEFLAGPGFGVKINEFLRIQASPFLGFGFEFENDQNLSEKYKKSFSTSASADECKFSFGAGSSVLFILFQKSRFSPVFGADFSCSFLCRDLIYVEKSNYHLDYENFFMLEFYPFLGFSYNF